MPDRELTWVCRDCGNEQSDPHECEACGHDQLYDSILDEPLDIDRVDADDLVDELEE